MDIVEDIKRTFKEGSVLTRLIYINLGVFLLVKIIGVFFYLAGQAFFMDEWLSLPSNFYELRLKPWTPLTYMFLHTGFMHLLFNILGLYWFGKLFLYHFEGSKLLSVYLLGGIAGAVLYIISYNVFPIFASINGLLLGASASVFAILVATAFYEPDRQIVLPFIGSFPLKYLAAFYVVLSIIGISTSNPGGNIAHLGGAAWGWFYIYQLRRGKDLGAGLVKFIDKIAESLKTKSNLTVSHKQAPRDDYEYNRQKKVQQDDLNKILDKIAKSGYDSLSKKEKELLFKQGKK
ncbi:MAG: rhomboid family intramembrane serine protease [Prolixibacteraceae bacterium]|jgi:membrane associated rhomboid family serine protease|nr:rhomboid family intramembrane serine protease [Prolixibacteraceae bacterium]MBT6765301.1 rhomboid family intramembrane serine protease [Prolixibacteraceae bacterium]MBT6997007.1 rhomboid family intramembrane serine protease [Prolixibacteraceae bacterium]MBT7396693.1 rhomboid family intramembrane serine protease [Prolixibacteraceae bacterium]